jgi:hypothetical protein
MTRDSFLDYWPSIRARTRRVAACIPADKLEWSVTPGQWTFGDLLRHLGGIERGMYAETVAGRPSAYPGHGLDLATGIEGVMAYLDRCHAESIVIFRALTPEQWDGKCQTPAGTPHHTGSGCVMVGMRPTPRADLPDAWRDRRENPADLRAD